MLNQLAFLTKVPRVDSFVRFILIYLLRIYNKFIVDSFNFIYSISQYKTLSGA